MIDPLKNADVSTLKPEDIVEMGVDYLESIHGDESDRLEYLESVYEGLVLMQGRPEAYFVDPNVSAWVRSHYSEILQAAQHLIQIERDKMAGRIQ